MEKTACWSGGHPLGAVFLSFVLLAAGSGALRAAGLPCPVVPFVKQCVVGEGTVRLEGVRIEAGLGDLAREVGALRAGLSERGVPMRDDGFPVRLEVAAVEFPPIRSTYRANIERQGYHLQVGPTGVVVRALAPQGVFYGIQTLLQLLDADQTLPVVDILDWPDLAERMVSVDSARQNENATYYRRLIEFLARYKINRLHWHLTDDENLSLYHEDYPTLLHAHAWRAEQIRPLVEFAREHYIEIMPEIESLGHARVFTRHPEFKAILHQTTSTKPSQTWAGTDVPGFTNVLCPASEKTYEYLARMYARATALFPYPVLHVGCDEVEATTCARCEQVFPGLSRPDWFARHLLRCHELATGRLLDVAGSGNGAATRPSPAAVHGESPRDAEPFAGRKMAMWGDMLLHHREIIDRLPRGSIIIHDWHYRRHVAPESAAFFKDRGFEVIGCPSLFCHPRMILPDDENYANIAAFARVARELDLRGLDTTIWTPTRYMSDALWHGIAYAAAQSWSGSNYQDDDFYVGFAREFFGSPDGRAFGNAWRDACQMRWWLDEFYPACWIDEQSLNEACRLVALRAEDIRALLARLTSVEAELRKLTAGVRRNEVAWMTIIRSVATRAYTMRHLLAAPEVRSGDRWNVALVRELDAGCVQALGWIEEDWDRNRWPDDPNKDGAYMNVQNLLYRFRQMHAFHQHILAESGGTPER